MKKYIVFSILLLFLPIIVFAQTFGRDLYYGLREDAEVIKLQEFLTSEGVYSGPITGNFFSMTLQGVKNFQAREGITPMAGYFGPISRTRANEILSLQITASDEQAIVETGGLPLEPELPKTISDVVKALQDQIATLLQQVSLLQQQLQSQQESQQTSQQQVQELQEIKQKTEEQTQILGEIKEQTKPEVKGCLNVNALNYNLEATISDGSCLYPEPEPEPEPIVIDIESPKITTLKYVAQDKITFITDELTTAKVYYLAFASSSTLQEAYQISQNIDYLNPVLQSEGEKTNTFWAEEELKTEHEFYYRNFLEMGKTYFFSIEVADETGNKFKQTWDWNHQITNK